MASDENLKNLEDDKEETSESEINKVPSDVEIKQEMQATEGLGKELTKEEVLQEISSKDNTKVPITNGIMWEYRKQRVAKKQTIRDFVDFLIVSIPLECENSEHIQSKISEKYDKLSSIRTTLMKQPQKYRGEVERLMEWPFDFPEGIGTGPAEVFEPRASANLGPKLLKVLKEKAGDDIEVADMSGEEDNEQVKKRKAREEIIQLKKDLQSARKTITSLNDKMKDLSKRCQNLKDVSHTSVSEQLCIERDVSKLSKDWHNIMGFWHTCMERLNHAITNKSNYMDVGYMVRRSRSKQGIFDELIYEFDKTVEECRYEVNSLLDKERRKKKQNSRDYRQKSKNDRKRVRDENDESDNAKKPCFGHSPEMSVEEVMYNFMGGKFLSALKVIYAELSAAPLNCTLTEFQNILEELENLNIDKISTSSFSGNILMELKMSVQIQFVNNLLKKCKLSISNNESVKFSYRDNAYDVTMPDETHIKLSVRNMSKGSPDTSVNYLKDLVAEVLAHKVEDNHKLDFMVKRAKVDISDSQLFDKKLLEIVYFYKQQMIPIFQKNLNYFPESSHSKIFQLNSFCSIIYLLLSFTKLIDQCAFLWEAYESVPVQNTDIDDKSEENDALLSQVAKNLHSFCDLTVGSGPMAKEFESFFLKNKGQFSPLAPHKENLFNLLYHNTAGIWFYQEVGLLSEFLENVKDHPNMHILEKLIKGQHSFAILKALGLIGKLFVAPLWIVMEADEAKMFSRLHEASEKLKSWMLDASKFMRGQDRLFNDVPISPDAVYVSLVKDNDVTDKATKSFLEFLFTSFESYFATSILSGFESGKREMVDPADTKLLTHLDFDVINRITICNHQLSSSILKGAHQYSNARNGIWEDKLNDRKYIEVFEQFKIKENITLKRALFKRKIVLEESSIKFKGEADSTNRSIEKNYELVDDLVKWGGLWKNEDQMHSYLVSKSENDRLNALKSQIKFRRYILQEDNSDGYLDLASNGARYNSSKLQEHLGLILHKEFAITKNNNIALATSSNGDEVYDKILKADRNSTSSPPSWQEGGVVKENYNWLLGKLIRYSLPSGQDKVDQFGTCIGRKYSRGLYTYYIEYKDGLVSAVTDTRVDEDFKTKNLQIVEPTPDDIIGKRVAIAFIKDDGELEWHDGTILGFPYGDSQASVEFDFYDYNVYVDEQIELAARDGFSVCIPVLDAYRDDHLRFL